MKELEFIHREASFVVVNKPGGLLAVPGRGPEMQDCVVNRLKAMEPRCMQQPAVHRLDMDTSGLMILAINKETHRLLSIQFEKRLVEKKYVALVDGLLTEDSGEITLSFRLDPENRPHQIFDPVRGKVGTTKWRKLNTEGNNTRVEFIPMTGRTHQLRLHSAHELGLGCPIVGDRLYGTGDAPGQMKLHASSLAFEHPETGKWLTFELPPNF